MGRGGPQDQDARVRHAHCVCRSHSQRYRYTKNRPIDVTVVFANGIYTPSARDARVRLGLVALPFPSRASGDKIRGRYSIRREVPSHLFRTSNPIIFFQSRARLRIESRGHTLQPPGIMADHTTPAHKRRNESAPKGYVDGVGDGQGCPRCSARVVASSTVWPCLCRAVPCLCARG